MAKKKEKAKKGKSKCLACGGSGMEEVEVKCVECKGKGKV